MLTEEWGDNAVDTAREHLPPGYGMEDAIFLLAGLNKMWIGDKVEAEVGPRKLNGHPAPLYILKHFGTSEQVQVLMEYMRTSDVNAADIAEYIQDKQLELGDVVDAWGLPSEFVQSEYIEKGYVRRYTGWGTDIVPQYLKEQHEWAFTLHIATPEKDHGPIILTVPMSQEERHFHNPSTLQDELKDRGDGPGSAAGIHKLLQGLELRENTLYEQGEPLPYQGDVLKPGWEERMGIESMET